MEPILPIPFTQKEFAEWAGGLTDLTSRVIEYFLAYIQALANDKERLAAAYSRVGLDPSNIPGTFTARVNNAFRNIAVRNADPYTLECSEETMAAVILMCKHFNIALPSCLHPMVIASGKLPKLPTPMECQLVVACATMSLESFIHTIRRRLGLIIRNQAKEERQHHTPCKECPFARHVPVGCTGGSPPEVYVGQALGPFALSCHMDPEYSQKGDPRDYLQCPGASIYRANVGVGDKMPDSFIHEPADPVMCFANAAELIAHHRNITVAEAEEILKQTPPEELLRRQLNASGVQHYLMKSK